MKRIAPSSLAQLPFPEDPARVPLTSLDPIPEALPQWVSLDVESNGLGKNSLPVGFALGTADQEIYLPFGHPAGRQHAPQNVRDFLNEELAGKDVIFRNVRSDAAWCKRWGVDLEAIGVRPHEVQHPAALLDDHRRKFKLEDLAQDRLGRGKLDTPTKRIGELPADMAAPYARNDGRLTFDLWQSYMPDIAREELDRVLELEDDLIWVTLAMEAARAPLDVDKLERWQDEVALANQDRVLEIHRRTGLRVNANTAGDLSKLFRHLGIKHTGFTTGDGDESFVETALLDAAGHYVGEGKARQYVVDVPEIHLALESRQLMSLQSKYLTKYLAAIEPGGFLPYQLHQLRGDDYGTITGRYSSSKVNIQQVKKPSKQQPVTHPWTIRELFIPAPGMRLFSADASQIEFRLFAHFSKSERLIKAYRDNPDMDFHKVVTEQILKDMMIRDLAKNFNFMKVYGGGIRRVMAMTGVDEEEAEELNSLYDRMFPEVRRMLRMAERLAERRHYVRTLLGRRRRFFHGDRFYSALNAAIQGSAADLLKLALLAIYRELRGVFLLRYTVHDEVVGDVADERAAARVMELLNDQRIPLRVPITWEGKTGDNWRLGWLPKAA